MQRQRKRAVSSHKTGFNLDKETVFALDDETAAYMVPLGGLEGGPLNRILAYAKKIVTAGNRRFEDFRVCVFEVRKVFPYGPDLHNGDEITCDECKKSFGGMVQLEKRHRTLMIQPMGKRKFEPVGEYLVSPFLDPNCEAPFALLEMIRIA